MKEYLEYVGLGIVMVVIWLVCVAAFLVCLLLPPVLADVSNNPGMFWLYLVTIPILGGVIGTIVYFGDSA